MIARLLEMEVQKVVNPGSETKDYLENMGIPTIFLGATDVAVSSGSLKLMEMNKKQRQELPGTSRFVNFHQLETPKNSHIS